MKLQNSKKIFKDALANGYGVGAFNFVNMEGLRAIIKSASELNSPVIVQCSTGAIKYAGAKMLASMACAEAEKLNIPVVLNLDHGKTYEDCVNAIDNGFTNVMIDSSSLPFEENVALTKRVVEYAHKHNVTVEAELGVLAGVEDEISASVDMARYTDPDQALEFVKRTGVDSLAVAIGTSHGPHKFKGESHLQFDILEKIQEKLPSFPFVLHGASSIPQDYVARFKKCGGKIEDAKVVDEKLLAHACKMNVCKVNVDSDLRIAYTVGVREYLNSHPECIDLRDYGKAGMSEISNLVASKIKDVFDSANKA